jgi:chemotaxis protein histidine kinase CheA/ActR/RegA family two-component response regulator
MTTSPLTPFFTEMRKELAQTLPDFEAWVGTIATVENNDPQLMEAIESYAYQLERIAQTAEMIGLNGLAAWVNTLNGVLPSVVFLEGDARLQAALHLASWPALFDRYLEEPANFDASLALAEFLAHPSLGQPCDEVERLKLLEALTVPPLVPEELLAELAQTTAPVSVSISDTSLRLPDNADRGVYDVFIDEAPSNVEQFSALTAKIASGHADLDDMRTAKRIAHSFKGSANIVGIRGIATLGHHTEDVLEYFEQNPVKPPKALARALVAASDCLAQMVGFLRGDESAPDNAFEVLSEIVAWANKVKSGEIEEMQEDAAVEVAPVATDAPRAELPAAATPDVASSEVGQQATLRVSVATVDEMYRLIGEMTSKIARLETQVLNVNTRSQTLLAHNQVVQQRVVDLEKLVLLRGMEINPTSAAGNPSFDPLEMDQYNELHGATRALVEVTADAREMANNLDAGLTNLRIEVAQQTQINKDLQHQVVSTRLAPVSSLAARLTRNVRQTCMQTGKQAELVITGGEIQVDGDVLNKLADPLLHLLRNAVDHGIEMPEERLSARKPADGIINLKFSRQGSGIVVTINDDGKGLDYPRIREKAIDRKLIREDQQLTHAELARLVLLPGFSTREAVSEISGRGVGMDVVATRLANIKGTVELNSVPGHGCEVVLKFQASLVTQHTLLVEAGQQRFAIPIHYIKEAFPGKLGEVNQASDGEWQFTIRDESYPLYDLTPLTGYPAAGLNMARCVALPKVLISTADGAKAVLVESIIESRSVMVKTMGKYLSRVHGVSGVTILGDGALVPLLNLPELLAAPLEVNAAAADLAASARLQARRILVVDDSLSVRKALMQLLQDEAFEVKGAGDGMEAIRAIDAFAPHLVCTDLEMPNMNGLELTQHLRLKEATRHLPIIMITSRSMDKHRDQAMQAGVDFYLTKPYTDVDLLKHVHQAMSLNPQKP